MKLNYLFILAFSLLLACKAKVEEEPGTKMESIAQQYISLALVIGQYDEAFVDAYYGPDSLKPTTPKATVFPKDSLLTAVRALKSEVDAIAQADTSNHRAAWMSDQLIAFDRRVRIFAGEYGTFDEESKDLFGAAAPTYDEAHYQQLVTRLDSLLPGKGTVPERFQMLANKFIIPKDKLDTVFKAAIAECRKRTLEHYQLRYGPRQSLGRKEWRQ